MRDERDVGAVLVIGHPGHRPAREEPTVDQAGVEDLELVVPGVGPDPGEQRLHDVLLPLQGLHEAVVGQQQGAGDPVLLVVRARGAEELTELTAPVVVRDPVAAPVDQPVDHCVVGLIRIVHVVLLGRPPARARAGLAPPFSDARGPLTG